MSSDSRPQGAFFERFNKLITAGWLTRLSPIQLCVLLAYLRHLNSDGSSWPGNALIAKYVGHQQSRHVRDARKQLVAMGFLRHTGRDAKAQTEMYDVIIPDVPVDTTSAPIPGTLPRNGAPCPDSARGGAPIPSLYPAPIPGTKQTIEQNKKDCRLPATPSRPSHNGNGHAPNIHQQAIDYFCQSWCAKYGTEYPFNKEKDAALVKSIRTAKAIKDNLTTFKQTVDCYLASTDPFIAEKRHPIGLLKSQLQQFIPIRPTTASNSRKAMTYA